MCLDWRRDNKKMAEKDTSDEVQGLPNEELRTRLARADWQNDVLYVSDERAFTLLRLAREAGDKSRVGLITEALSARIFAKAAGFARRSGIVPGLISDLNDAAADLGAYVWVKILGSAIDAKYAEVRFGQLFKRRALDFQRHLLAKKHTMQESLDAMDRTGDDEDQENAEKSVTALKDDWKPEDSLQQKQEFKKLRSVMHDVLTPKEFSVLQLLYDFDMLVKDVADALDVTPRTVLNLRVRALKKLGKELAK
jgi:RNA polymerase sigma factor (sigma-70 family)